MWVAGFILFKSYIANFGIKFRDEPQSHNKGGFIQNVSQPAKVLQILQSFKIFNHFFLTSLYTAASRNTGCTWTLHSAVHAYANLHNMDSTNDNGATHSYWSTFTFTFGRCWQQSFQRAEKQCDPLNKWAIGIIRLASTYFTFSDTESQMNQVKLRHPHFNPSVVSSIEVGNTAIKVVRK